MKEAPYHMDVRLQEISSEPFLHVRRPFWIRLSKSRQRDIAPRSRGKKLA